VPGPVLVAPSADTDELATSTATGELSRDMDTAYADGEQAFLASAAAQRTRLLDLVYGSILPATDAELTVMEQLHAADPPTERADIALFLRQWNAVRDLLTSAEVASQFPAGLPPACRPPTSLSARTWTGC
jgi:hypothetical protein